MIFTLFGAILWSHVDVIVSSWIHYVTDQNKKSSRIPIKHMIHERPLETSEGLLNYPFLERLHFEKKTSVVTLLISINQWHFSFWPEAVYFEVSFTVRSLNFNELWYFGFWPASLFFKVSPTL